MKEMVENKRFVAEIELSIHKRIRFASAWKNISMKKYVLQAIMKSLAEDEKYSRQ
jgi:predicted HicB family RNase H-like nuclease